MGQSSREGAQRGGELLKTQETQPQPGPLGEAQKDGISGIPPLVMPIVRLRTFVYALGKVF